MRSFGANTLNKIGEESSWNSTLLNLRVRSSFGQLIKSLAASDNKIKGTCLYTSIFSAGNCGSNAEKTSAVCSPGVGDTNTDQQRRKRCENSNLENGL